MKSIFCVRLGSQGEMVYNMLQANIDRSVACHPPINLLQVKAQRWFHDRRAHCEEKRNGTIRWRTLEEEGRMKR